MTTESVETRPCPRCQSVIEETVDTVHCAACGAAYHAACAQAQECCAVPGCPAAAPAETAGAPRSDNPVPPTPSLRTTFTYGWAAFRRFAAPLYGAVLLYVLVSMAMRLPHPAIAIFFGIFLDPPLTGGIIWQAMKAVRGDSPRARGLFSGFARFWRWVGANLLLMLIGIAILLPMFTIFIIGASASVFASVGPAHSSLASPAQLFALLKSISPVLIALAILVPLLMVVIFCAIMMRWIFVFNLIADGYGVLAAFGHSARLTKGQRLRFFGIFLVIGLVMMPVALLMFLPSFIIDIGGISKELVLQVAAGLCALILIPFSFCLDAALYYAAKAQRGA